MAFAGWPDEALAFYEGLEADNSKSYWTSHKAVYDDAVLRPMNELTEELAAELGPVFGTAEPKIFRPYRDVRFSRDKTPYKTNIAATVGAHAYIHLSADGLGAGTGVWQFGPEPLSRYRAAVADDSSGPELQAVLAAIEASGAEIHGHGTLKSAPRGYPADHPRIGLLRHKGLTAWQGWPPEPWLATPAAKDRVVDFLRASAPLVAWLSRHVED